MPWSNQIVRVIEVLRMTSVGYFQSHLRKSSRYGFWKRQSPTILWLMNFATNPIAFNRIIAHACRLFLFVFFPFQSGSSVWRLQTNLLSSHHGNTESRKNLEQMDASRSTNLFSNSCHHFSTNAKLLHTPIKPTKPLQFLYSLLQRANARNVSFSNLSQW